MAEAKKDTDPAAVKCEGCGGKAGECGHWVAPCCGHCSHEIHRDPKAPPTWP